MSVSICLCVSVILPSFFVINKLIFVNLVINQSDKQQYFMIIKIIKTKIKGILSDFPHMLLGKSGIKLMSRSNKPHLDLMVCNRFVLSWGRFLHKPLFLLSNNIQVYETKKQQNNGTVKYLEELL